MFRPSLPINLNIATKFIISVFLSSLSVCLFGQERKEVYNHAVFWHKTEVNEMFNDKWGAGIDFIYRTKSEMDENSIHNMFDSHHRTSIRGWVHYQLSKTSRLSFAPMAYFHTNEYVGKETDRLREPFHELRTTFQFFHHHKHLGERLMHTWRYRYEWRWMEQQNQPDYRFFHRIRFMYRARFMLNSDSFYQNNTLYAVAFNEIGINFGENVVLNIFNQNRISAGLGFRFMNAVRAEARYIHRFRTRGATGYEFDQANGFMFTISIDQASGIGRQAIQKVRFAD